MTKTELVRQCRLILHAGCVTASDFRFLMDEVLPRHPNYDDKIGVGVVGIESRHNQFGMRCFWLVRADGTETDFSFYKCAGSRTQATELKKSLRKIVVEDVMAFKMSSFSNSAVVLCAITGELTLEADCHVDHRPPQTFDRIVADWLKHNQLKVEDIELTSDDGQIGKVVADSGIRNSFRVWHADHASLQITTAVANLRQGRGGVRFKK